MRRAAGSLRSHRLQRSWRRSRRTAPRGTTPRRSTRQKVWRQAYRARDQRAVHGEAAGAAREAAAGAEERLASVASATSAARPEGRATTEDRLAQPLTARWKRSTSASEEGNAQDRDRQCAAETAAARCSCSLRKSCGADARARAGCGRRRFKERMPSSCARNGERAKQHHRCRSAGV
eukprot:5775365-Pleurochrysis_carterae.AAC.1